MLSNLFTEYKSSKFTTFAYLLHEQIFIFETIDRIELFLFIRSEKDRTFQNQFFYRKNYKQILSL